MSPLVKKSASLPEFADEKQRWDLNVDLGVKTKTNLATETREESKTLFKMAAKQTTISCFWVLF